MPRSPGLSCSAEAASLLLSPSPSGRNQCWWDRCQRLFSQCPPETWLRRKKLSWTYSSQLGSPSCSALSFTLPSPLNSAPRSQQQPNCSPQGPDSSPKTWPLRSDLRSSPSLLILPLSFISLPPPPFFSGSKNDTTYLVTPGLPCPSFCQALSVLSPQCVFTGPGLDYLLNVVRSNLNSLWPLSSQIHLHPSHHHHITQKPSMALCCPQHKVKHGSGLEAFHGSTQSNHSFFFF